jgi:hypothetical protein
MESLATDQLTRQEVLGLNLADWITKGALRLYP